MNRIFSIQKSIYTHIKSQITGFALWLCLSLLFIFVFLPSKSFAQAPIKKEVEVVKPYEPVVSDANKINVLPQVKDSVIIKPAFNYNIVPMVANTEYNVPSINAAKMLQMPIQKLYKSYLKLGYGNYSTPLAEVYVNSLRSKKYSVGAFLRHQSSAGNVKLENNKKVYGGYNGTSAEVSGKRFLKKSYLYGDAGIKQNTVYRYGFLPTIDTVVEKGNLRQSYLLANMNAGFRSLNTDSSKLTYQFGVGYNYFKDREKRSERNFSIHGRFNRLFEGKMVGLNASFDRFGRNAMLDSTGNVSSLFVLSPWVGISKSEYRLQFGFNVSFAREEGFLKPHFYPQADLQFNVVKEVLIPFVGITGEIQNHSYREIATENPFINPGLLVKNSNNRIKIYGGVKGSLGSKASYVLKINVSKTDNQYFFINDTLLRLRNEFNVSYDDVEVFNGYGEINFDYSESLSFAVKGNFYKYTLSFDQYAWHKPSSDLMVSTKYNLRNKILLNLDVLAMGKRYAKLPKNEVKKLPSALDFNLGVEYRYTKILSFWLKFNNFTASKYYMWNQYPSQRFNMMAGLTYSL